MKKNALLASVLVLTSAILPAPAVAQSALHDEESSPVPLLRPRRVAVGMTRGELTLAAGTPDATLDASVWVYWKFRTTKVPADKNHDALMVVFEKDRVKFFKFCAAEPVEAFIARQKAAARSTIAAK